MKHKTRYKPSGTRKSLHQQNGVLLIYVSHVTWQEARYLAIARYLWLFTSRLVFLLLCSLSDLLSNLTFKTKLLISFSFLNLHIYTVYSGYSPASTWTPFLYHLFDYPLKLHILHILDEVSTFWVLLGTLHIVLAEHGASPTICS